MGKRTNKQFLNNVVEASRQNSVSCEPRQRLQLPGCPGRLARQPGPGEKHNAGTLWQGTGQEDGPNQVRNRSC